MGDQQTLHDAPATAPEDGAPATAPEDGAQATAPEGGVPATRPEDGAPATAPVAGIARPLIASSNSFHVPDCFAIRAVDPTAIPGDKSEDPVPPAFGHLDAPGPDELDPEIEATNASEAAPHDDNRMGGLNEFVGNFHGNGLNIIFRPRNGPGMAGNHDNLLEINLTKERLQFLSQDILKAIPNRGFGSPAFGLEPQKDLHLRGVPYMQQIEDLIDHSSFTLREPGVPIHFEQGLFLRTPALDRPVAPDKIGATLSRLASIPHGTTINLQCLDPGFDWIEEPPNLGSSTIRIRPFGINNEQDPKDKEVPFFDGLQLEKTKGTRNRLPNKLQGDDVKALENLNAILNFKDPVQTLRDFNEHRTIVRHRKLHFDSKSQPVGIPGISGGTSNIVHLQGVSKATPGSEPTDANANAVRVTCTYWISVVEVDLTVGPTAHQRVEVRPTVKAGDVPEGVSIFHPTFIVPLKRPLSEAVSFKAEYVQIQYAQNVTLDFGPLSWPHISVASLIPAGLDNSGKIELISSLLPEKLQ